MRTYFAAMIAALVLLLASCSSVTSTPAVSIASTQGIAILPLTNLSTTPLAGEQVAAIAESSLRSRGAMDLATYQPANTTGVGALLATSLNNTSGLSWARESGYEYALSGTVHEWHYKGGPDREPSVGVSLSLTNLNTNQVVWQATSAKAGWGFSSLSTVGQKLVNDLLSNVRVQSNR